VTPVNPHTTNPLYPHHESLLLCIKLNCTQVIQVVLNKKQGGSGSKWSNYSFD
jgi:hypothetical protein